MDRNRVTRNDPSDPPIMAPRVPRPDAPHTDMGWEVYPEGLTETLVMVTERYGKIPLYITENGAAYDDPTPGRDGIVEDPRRVAYLKEHLRAARRAIALGVDLRGYFAWSLMDNFEWQYGYSKRFGLIHVDFATQKRTIKRSGRFYREAIESGGRTLEAGA